MTICVVGLYLLGAAGMWRLATVFPANRARIAAMVVYVATPLVPGRPRDGPVVGAGLVRGAAVAGVPAPARGRHRHRRPGHGRRRPRRRRRPDLAARPPAVHGALGARARPRPRRSCRWRSCCSCVGVVLARRRCSPADRCEPPAGWPPRRPSPPSWPRCSTCRGRRRGRGPTLVGPPIEGPRGDGLASNWRRSRSTGASSACSRSPCTCPVVAALAISRAWRLTWAVRGCRAGARVRRVDAARRSRRAAVRRARAGHAAGAGRARPRARCAAVAGGDRRRRARTRVRLAPAGGRARQRGDRDRHRPRRARRSATARGTPRERRSRPSSARSSRSIRPRATTGCCTSAIRGCCRCPVGSTATGSPSPSSTTARSTSPTAGRLPRPTPTRSSSMRSTASPTARRCAPARCSRRPGSATSCVPEIDGAQSTADDPIPVPDGLIEALSDQLDIGASYGPPTIRVFAIGPWIPVAAQLTGCHGGRQPPRR